MITCTQAIREEFKDTDQILTATQLIGQIQKKYPGKWKGITIRTHLIGCSINHNQSKWYPNFEKFLYTIEPGKMRLFNPEKDGKFKKSFNGLKIQLASAEESPREGKAFELNRTTQKDMQKYLRKDISRLDSRLRLFSENGVGVSFEAAKNDILAMDSEGRLAVIKLRGDLAHISALGQILNSMASIKNEFGEVSVRGIIIAEGFDDELILAAKKTPNISLVRYKVEFTFEAAG